jgi:predicted PurR-regulated permease PerM
LAIYYWPAVSGVLITVLSSLVPLLVGCGIAYIVNLLMVVFEGWYFPKSNKKWAEKTRGPVCLLASVVSLLAAIALIIIIVLPQLKSCIQVLLDQIPGALAAVVDGLAKWNILPEDIIATLESIDWKSLVSNFFGTLSSGVTNIVNVIISIVTSVIGGFITAFLSVIFAVYLLLGKKKLGRQADIVMKRYMKISLYSKVKYVIEVLNNSFRRYIVGQCTEAVILGVLCALGMWIFRLPYAAMIGALIAFTSLVPIAGAYIGGAIGAFMIFTVSPVKALFFIIYLVVLQQIEGNLIYPRVVGSSIGLPAIWVLAAVTVGGGIMGVLGMLLGVPLAAAIYKILGDHVKKVPAEKLKTE